MKVKQMTKVTDSLAGAQSIAEKNMLTDSWYKNKTAAEKWVPPQTIAKQKNEIKVFHFLDGFHVHVIILWIHAGQRHHLSMECSQLENFILLNTLTKTK